MLLIHVPCTLTNVLLNFFDNNFTDLFKYLITIRYCVMRYEVNPDCCFCESVLGWLAWVEDREQA
jgi:hypothetical protein